MKPAPVQNPSFVASHSCTSGTLFSLLVACFLFCSSIHAQTDTISQIQTPSSSLSLDVSSLSDGIADFITTRSPSLTLTSEQKKKRQWLIGSLNVVGYGTSIIIFNNQWYKNYPRTSFHTFNDSKEWLQMDKLGHAWASYNSGRASSAMWRWAGLSDKKAAWIGGLSSTVYLTVIEFLDAHSSKWGWSWADMGANVLGSGLFISQQLGWHEQRVQYKFSFHHKNYSDPMLKERADDLFGKNWTERMLKDYNGQTYWFSFNLKSFFKHSNLPSWLNISVGYGADGMFGGFENKWTDGDPGFPIDRTDIKRYRQWYLAPDIDFSKIKTDKKAIKVLLDFLNCFKIPSPALELSGGNFKLKGFYF